MSENTPTKFAKVQAFCEELRARHGVPTPPPAEMTIKELKALIAELPDDATVELHGPGSLSVILDDIWVCDLLEF